MAVPIYEVISTSIAASASFTTNFHVFNYSNAAIQVIWSGLDATNGTVRCRASNKLAGNYQNLTANPVTLTTAAGEHIFNIYDIGYGYIQLYYDNASNTTGSFEVVSVRKAFG